MELSKGKKWFIIILGSILISVMLLLSISELFIAKYINTKNILYSYSSKGSMDYKVYLKPNIMYNEKYLGKGRFYIFKYIDYVDIDFNYEYTATAYASLKTEYSVVAYLQGLHGENNEVLWSKEYVISPDNIKQMDDSKINIKFKMPIPLSNYATEKETLYLNSEVNAPVVLNVVFKVHTNALTSYGSLDDNISPNLSIPIGESVFKVEGKPEITGAKKIEQNHRAKIPVNMGKVILLFAASAIILVLMIMVKRTKEAPTPDVFEKNIDNIFKEYSERLASMEHTISYQFADVINVSSIEDMIKIADEVGQPVFYYKVNSNVEKKIEFFVFDNSRVYYMVIFGEIASRHDED